LLPCGHKRFGIVLASIVKGGDRKREIERGSLKEMKRKRRELAAVGSQQTPSSELKPNHLQAAKSVNV